LLRTVFLALLWAVPDNAGRRHGPDGYVACPDGFVMAQFEKNRSHEQEDRTCCATEMNGRSTVGWSRSEADEIV
jgi:hypothetical protein